MRFLLPLIALLGASAFATDPKVPPPAGVTIPSAQTIAEMVPATGKLGERELILMAISRRPELDKLRGAIAVAKAQRQAAGDLVNPELRFSYAQDNDDRMDEPNSLESSNSVTSSSIGGLAQPQSVVSGESATPDSSEQDNAWGVLVRFSLPHPWERKARIQRAAAEISLAEAEYYAGEDQVVRTVRAAFQELAILQAKLAAQQSRKVGSESYRNWLDEQKTLRLGLDLASARAKVYGTLSDIRALENEIAATREHLAAYCGLADASRMELEMMNRRISHPAALDINYLTDIAMLYRSDVLGNQARLAVARAQLSEARAARIPFATFIDLGYTQETSVQRTGRSEEWFVRMGVSIPLWEWTGINKKHKVPEAASQSLERELAMQRSIISAEIAQAIKRLIVADQQLASADKDLADLKSDQKKAQDETHLATADMNDLIKGKRIENEFQDLARQMEVTRFSAFSAYHEVLMAVEKALGIRLERALKPASLAHQRPFHPVAP